MTLVGRYLYWLLVASSLAYLCWISGSLVFADHIEEFPTDSATANGEHWLGFQGQFSDPVTGLAHLNARLYSPDTAQFLSPDSFPGLSEVPSSLNKYAYAHNDPVNYWDQSGLYGSEVHYDKTLEWSRDTAAELGFSYGNGVANFIGNKLAVNIAAFDQYHDKEWSLAPNNYSDFEDGMTSGGQGNSLHFMNPERNQMQFMDAGVRNAIAGNGFVDPLARAVDSTLVPIYAMRSLDDFNDASGADRLSTRPQALREQNGYKGTLVLNAMDEFGNVSASGNVAERMRYAIAQHDPRLFGIALHEYQDTFAHAGFEKWHGTSSDNDIYCETRNESVLCNPDIVGQLDPYDSSAPSRAIKNTREALYQRDQLMREGTDYWMRNFMNEMKNQWQIDAESGLYATQEAFNQHKMEKMMDSPVATLRVNEEFSDPKFAGNLGGTFGVYNRQGAGVGGAPCLDLFEAIDFSLPTVTVDLAMMKSNYPNCSIYFDDYAKRIVR